ncbi:MAG: Zn-ribbon containing protein, partial [Nanoarchaeota archaeon]
MANQCIHCSETYPDGAPQTLEGCSKCGSRFFFYLSEEKLRQIQKQKGEIFPDLTAEDKETIEQDVREITGIEEIDAPVILDIETVKVMSPGKYLLDIPNLFSKERPLIYKLADGKYVIDLSTIK